MKNLLYFKDKEIETITRYGMKDKSIIMDMKNLIRDEVTGFLTVDCIISRTGVQDYLGFELGEDNDDIIGVYRSDEEVTASKSLKTFTNITVTDEHPDELVTADNIHLYGKGSISIVNVVQLEGVKCLQTKLTVTDKDLISSIQGGKKELSVGYTSGLVESEGTHDGKAYKYKLIDIIGNHVAVVDAGRCGGICKLMIDKKSKSDQRENVKMKITINGVEYEVPEEVANAYTSLKSKVEGMEENATSMEAKVGDMEEEVKTSNDTIAQLNAKIDAGKGSVNDSKVNALVDEKLTLITFAKDANIEGVKPEQTSKQMKCVIVDSLGGASEGKGETYLDAFIDVKKTELKEGKDTFTKQMRDAQTHKPQNSDTNVTEHEDKEI